MHNTLKTLALASLILAAGTSQARDLGPDEALRLRDAGTVQDFEKLNTAALAQHPGGQVLETELEDRYGRYIYQLDILDSQGLKWELELDASSGELLRNQRDD